MRHHAEAAVLPLLLALCAVSALAAPRVARDQPGGLGSAIALEYSVQHDVMRPGEAVTLLLCLTNQNPESRRDVQAGDSFAITFASGSPGPCGAVSVISPAGDLQPGDFDCAADGQSIRLTRVGATTQWPPLDSLCVRVPFSVPATSTRGVPSMSVGNVGAFRAPAPAAVLLSIADDLGSVGPQGETGPAGPSGPAGAAGTSGVGAAVMALSTGRAIATQNEPPVPVPGLDVTLQIEGGSRIEVHVNASAYRCISRQREHSPILMLEVDSLVVAERSVTDTGIMLDDFRDELLDIAWLSDAMDAGAHRVRVLLDVSESHPAAHDESRCVGSAADDHRQCRLIVKEIRSAP